MCFQPKQNARIIVGRIVGPALQICGPYTWPRNCVHSMMTDNDSEWAPPSEAEMKVINARRERSDKISKLMSQYLLKGYKMLATTCSKCQAIELQTKERQVYCVACSEVDCEETSKDNPVLSRQAAEAQLREAAASASSASASASAVSEAPSPGVAMRNARLIGEVDQSIASVANQMSRARDYLSNVGGFDPTLTRSSVAAIKECAECILTLEKLKAEIK